MDFSSIRSILSGLMPDARGMGNALQSSGTGPTQIPTGMQSTYEPQQPDGMNAGQIAAISSMLNGMGETNTPEMGTEIYEPTGGQGIQEQGILDRPQQGVSISPIFGKQSIDEINRMKMAEMLRGS